MRHHWELFKKDFSWKWVITGFISGQIFSLLIQQATFWAVER